MGCAWIRTALRTAGPENHSECVAGLRLVVRPLPAKFQSITYRQVTQQLLCDSKVISRAL